MSKLGLKNSPFRRSPANLLSDQKRRQVMRISFTPFYLLESNKTVAKHVPSRYHTLSRPSTAQAISPKRKRNRNESKNSSVICFQPWERSPSEPCLPKIWVPEEIQYSQMRTSPTRKTEEISQTHPSLPRNVKRIHLMASGLT